MKKVRMTVVACAAMIAGGAHATTYYVSTSGLNTNPGTTATKPWKTLDKVNGAALKSGDSVLFASGQTWEGTLQVKSGVTYDKTGTGAQPKITGSRNVGALNWTVHSGKIYKTNIASLVGSGSMEFLVDATGRYTRARFPNVGSGEFKRGANKFLRAASMPGDLSQATRDVLTANEQQILPTVPGAISAANLSALPGAYVYHKNYDWNLARYKVTSTSGALLGVTADTTWNASNNAVVPEMGYWLENQLWMLDSAGEWYYDASTKDLYLWTRDGTTPKGKAIYAVVDRNAIVASGASSFAVKNIDVTDTNGDAVLVTAPSTAFTLSGMNVVRSGGAGISVSYGANLPGLITSNNVTDSVREGIYAATGGLTVSANSVTRAGMGGFAMASIYIGNNGTAKDNRVVTSARIGIHGARDNTITGNVVTDACKEFDDCGAIYVNGFHFGLSGGALNTQINNNVVVGALSSDAPDRLDGVAGFPDGTAVKGIYLDDFASSVTVSGNYVSNVDHGLMLHYGANNTLSGNTVVNNTKSQLWMQENWTSSLVAGVCNKLGLCDTNNYTQGNSVSGNIMATNNGQPLIRLESDFGDTADFAAFSNNKYHYHGVMGNGSPVFAQERALGVVSNRTLASWQGPSVLRDGGSTLVATGNALKPSTGSSIAANGSFDVDANGWYAWRGDAVVSTQACVTANCLSLNAVTTGADQAELVGGKRNHVLHTTAAMSLSMSKRYLLVFDAKAQNAGDSISTLIASNLNYAPLSERRGVVLSADWQRYALELKPLLAEANTARLEFDLLSSGAIYFDNVRLLEVSQANGGVEPRGLVNATTSNLTVQCPNTALSATQCGSASKYVDSAGAKVSFPLTLAPKASKVVRWVDTLWLDTDFDSVPDGSDSAPATASGLGVNETGRAIGQ
jgi:parallel beta-helix repeat protein